MRLWPLALLGLALLLGLAAGCSGPEHDKGGPAALLKELGFTERQGSSSPPARNFSKQGDGLTLWASLPQAKGQQEHGPVLLIKVNGPNGSQSARTDQALMNLPEMGKLVQEASHGVYPPEALREILGQALAGASQPPGNGAVITSPKRGFSLRVSFERGHIRLVALMRHPVL